MKYTISCHGCGHEIPIEIVAEITNGGKLVWKDKYKYQCPCCKMVNEINVSINATFDVTVSSKSAEVPEDSKLDIRKGDTVEIHAKFGIVRGKVMTADYFRGDGGWYIELITETGGYRYYKQQFDGGYVCKID